MGKLYIVVEDLASETRETYELDTPRITIGRGSHTDITVRDRSLMDVHAIVEIDDGQAQFVHFDSEHDAIIDGRMVPAKRLSRLSDPTEVTLNECVRLKMSMRAPSPVVSEARAFTADGAVPERIVSSAETLSIPIRTDTAETKEELEPLPAAPTEDAPSWSTEAPPVAAVVRADQPADVKAGILAPGMRIADNYEVVRPLGVGGMGAVYKGIDHRRRR